MRRKLGPPRVAVVVPAGGQGTRMGGRLPKQFLTLRGEPILVATVRRMSRIWKSTPERLRMRSTLF